MQTTTSIQRAALICLVGGLFYCMDYLVQVSPSVMVDQIMQHFHCDALGIAVMGSFFFYGYALMQLPAGMLLDRYGHRGTLSLAMIGCALSVLLFAHSMHFLTATIARFFIGISSAFSFIGTIALIRRYLPNAYFTTAVGVLQLLGAMGSLIGQAPLAILDRALGWQHSLSLLAFTLIILALLLFASQHKTASITAQQPAIATPNNTALYRKALRQPKLWLLLGCGVLCWVPVGSLGALWGIPFLKVSFHLSDVKASQLMIYFWLGLATTPVIGRIADITQHTQKLIIGNFIIAAIAAWILLHNHSLLLSSLSLYLIGLSCATQALTFQVAKQWFDVAIFSGLCGLLNMAAIIGGGLSQYLTGIMLQHAQPGIIQSSDLYRLSSYQHALYVVPLCAVLGAFISLWLRDPTISTANQR